MTEKWGIDPIVLDFHNSDTIDRNWLFFSRVHIRHDIGGMPGNRDPKEESFMANRYVSERGIERLIKKYVREFRIPENLMHYAPNDFSKAEKQFVKFCLANGLFTEAREGAR